MRLEHVVSLAIDRVLGRLLRRAAAMAALVLIALIAIYHFTVAGTLALDAQFGLINARLIIAGIYLVVALAIFAFLLATRAKARPQPQASSAPLPLGEGFSEASDEERMAMLIESVLLGYSLARGKSR